MNQLLSDIQSYISTQEADSLEYGNLTRGSEWGGRIGNRVIWVFVVEMIWRKAMQYKIIYNIDKGTFTSFSDFGRKLQFDNFVQFNSGSISGVTEKVAQLVKDMPAFREKMLREYFFSKRSDQLNFRWSKFFKRHKKDDEEKYLIRLIEKMRTGNRISQSECERLTRYIRKLRP